MASRFTLAAAVGFAAGLAFSADARAGDPVRADALFQEALTLLDAGDWARACPKFLESYTADASVGALLNLGACHEREGKLLEAKARYLEALERNRSVSDSLRQEAVRAEVEKAMSALETRTPRILVTGLPVGAQLTIDGKPVQAIALAGVAVDPGEHVVRATAVGFKPSEVRVSLKEAERRPIALTLAPQPTPPTPAPPSGGPKLIVPGVMLLAGGLAAAGTGAGLLGLTAAKASEVRELCGQESRPPSCLGSPEAAAEASDISASAKQLEIAGSTLTAVGAAVAIGGLVLMVVSPSDAEAPAAALSVDVGPRRAGLGLHVRF